MRRGSISSLIVMMFVSALVAAIPSVAQEKPKKGAPTAVAKPGLGDFDAFVNQALKDMVWYRSDFSREDIIHRLQYLEPNKPLRSTFQYNNLMFMTAGYIAGLLNGKSWEDTIRERIFTPLGMNGTNFSLKDSQGAPDFALPYREGNDVKTEVKRMAFDEQCPARCAVRAAGWIESCPRAIG